MMRVVRQVKDLAVFLAAFLVQTVTAVALTAVLALSFATIQNLYKGDWVIRPGYRTSGTATVLDCVRTGFLSTYGFGRWWICYIVVDLADGRSPMVTVGHSIVTPSDRGRRVKIVEFCRERAREECTYARPGNFLLTVGAGQAAMLKMAVLVHGVAMLVLAPISIIVRTGIVLGIIRRRGGDARLAVSGEQSVGKPGIPSGHGLLVIVFTYPNSAVRELYKDQVPLMTVDGQLIDVALSWGEHRIPLRPGKRKCEVWFPMEGFRFGRVSRKITITEGSATYMTYRASTTPGRPGTLEHTVPSPSRPVG